MLLELILVCTIVLTAVNYKKNIELENSIISLWSVVNAIEEEYDYED